MVAVSVSNLQHRLLLEIDGQVYSVIEFQHHNPGRGGAVVRTKLRNIKLDTIVERTFKSTEKIELADVDKRMVQYQYQAGDEYHFMDLETYQDLSLSAKSLGDNLNYLTEGMEVKVWIHKGEAIGLELPAAVDLKVVETSPAFKGNTAAGNTKPAKLETGLVVQVPYFIETGEVLRVDTRTGQYLERAK